MAAAKASDCGDRPSSAYQSLLEIRMANAQQFALRWDLDSILPHPESAAFAEALNRFRRDLSTLADDSDRLPEVASAPASSAAWGQFLRRIAENAAMASDLNSFVACHAAADAENANFRKLEATLAALEPQKERIATNVDLALRDVDVETLDRFIRANSILSENAFFLRERRLSARFRLPKAMESLAAELAVDGIHAWGRLYDRVSGALRIRIMERGEIVERSPGQVQFDSPERSVRENNFYASDRAWKSIADTCADALNHIAGTRLAIYRRLGLPGHLEAPLRYNRMTRSTLDAMWSAVSARKPVLLKYLKKKAELVGLDRLSWYDVPAPLPQAALVGGQTLSYDDACDQIIRTFDGFSADLGRFARSALGNRWAEVENRSGKRQGGFCTWFPTARQSRIFMTFTDSSDSMSTLAHELGHAYHSHVLREQPYFLQDYPMNLAETASTFAEAVLNEERLKEAANRKQNAREEQLVLLDSMLGDSVAYLMNIHARYLFEDRFYQERAAGELSASQLSELMCEAQQAAFCDELASDGWYPNFWISKLHFYMSTLPFYNFPYTFGYLLSLGVYAVASDFGDQFADRYRQLLLATGSYQTEEAVKRTLGFDLTSSDFWNRSLDVVEQRVARFLELAG
jgi:pepF/M3 family oligoendopeptidase